MPIYEYECLTPAMACQRCLRGFEVIQAVDDRPLSCCPECGHKVRKLISWCRTAIVEASEEHSRVENKIREYESQGLWSHAAELADKQSEKAKDKDMRLRALDNYKKAGYDAASLEKHAKLDNE